MWDTIADRVSATNLHGIVRTADEMRKKWSNMASDTKKRTATRRRESQKTGGGPSVDFGDNQGLDNRIAGILGPTAIHGIDGGLDTSETPTP